MKTNQHVQPTIADDFSSVSFTVKGHDVLKLDMGKLHPDIIRRAACVGMAQVRIVDAAAVSSTDKEGKIIPEAERVATKYENMAALIAHYESGTADWSRVATAAGPKGGYLFEALCKMYANKTPEAIRTYLDGLSDKQQAALREDDTVAPVIAAIKAEKNAGKPKEDTKALLTGLTAEPVETPSEEVPAQE